MIIGIFGNTNNYPYLLAAGLRSLGVDVRLVVNRADRLHRPESKDAALASGYPSWILDVASIDEEHFVAQSAAISDVVNFLFEGTDGVVLNDIGPSLAGFAHSPAVALLTGSDLTYYANYATLEARRTNWDADFVRSAGGRLTERRWAQLIARQRDGLLRATAVSYAFPGLIPEGDELLRAIGVQDVRRFLVYMADTERAQPAEASVNHRTRVLNSARLNWGTSLPPGFSAQDNKGSDILLRGFAQFVREGGDAELRLVRKGLRVNETEELVRSLDIDDFVVWLDEMDLAEYYGELSRADVVCDQLGTSFPGMASLDAMATGKPVLANFRLDVLQKYFPEPWPVLQATTAEDVCRHLGELCGSASRRRQVGKAAQAFARKYLSPQANARMCLERLGQMR